MLGTERDGMATGKAGVTAAVGTSSDRVAVVYRKCDMARMKMFNFLNAKVAYSNRIAPLGFSCDSHRIVVMLPSS